MNDEQNVRNNPIYLGEFFAQHTINVNIFHIKNYLNPTPDHKNRCIFHGILWPIRCYSCRFIVDFSRFSFQFKCEHVNSGNFTRQHQMSRQIHDDKKPEYFL